MRRETATSNRTPRAGRRRAGAGFTFIELLMVLALMAILALAAQPYVHFKARQQKELELERSLRTMRNAIDRYHEYAILGFIEPWDLAWSFYPEDLESLVEGIEVTLSPEEEPVIIRFLREIPIDPITSEAEWSCRGYDDDPDERSSRCDDLYDVFSTAVENAMDGSYYADW